MKKKNNKITLDIVILSFVRKVYLFLFFLQSVLEW